MTGPDDNVRDMVPSLLREIRDAVKAGFDRQDAQLERVNTRLDALHDIMQRQDGQLSERVTRLESQVAALLGARQ